MPPLDSRSKNIDGDKRHESIRRTVQMIDGVLQPYVNRAENHNRVENLTEAVKSAARLGFKLFSQRVFWDFEWSRSGSDNFSIAPALVRITDEHGNKVEYPERIYEGITLSDYLKKKL